MVALTLAVVNERPGDRPALAYNVVTTAKQFSKYLESGL
jgi:hypothetical protein